MADSWGREYQISSLKPIPAGAQKILHAAVASAEKQLIKTMAVEGDELPRRALIPVGVHIAVGHLQLLVHIGPIHALIHQLLPQLFPLLERKSINPRSLCEQTIQFV